MSHIYIYIHIYSWISIGKKLHIRYILSNAINKCCENWTFLFFNGSICTRLTRVSGWSSWPSCGRRSEWWFTSEFPAVVGCCFHVVQLLELGWPHLEILLLNQFGWEILYVQGLLRDTNIMLFYTCILPIDPQKANPISNPYVPPLAC